MKITWPWKRVSDNDKPRAIAAATATATMPACATGPRAITGAQSVASSLGGAFSAASSPATYATYREMRRHPTIALARALAVAPIVAARWSVAADKDAPDGAADLITSQFLPIREPLVEQAMLGGCDFGHQPWEKVLGLNPDGYQVIRRFKPLLQDITEILTDKPTGAYTGFRQNKSDVPLANCLLISFRVEGTDWRGQSLLENARSTWTEWREANGGAARYDKKIAGSHFMIRFPIGRSRDINGAYQDNRDLATWILAALESSGSVAFPDEMASYMEGLAQNNSSWRIELLSDSTPRQPSFIERLNYLDKLLVRAILVPERAVLEGEHGTLAEATAHADAALQHAELQHRHVTRMVNWHAVDQVLWLNYGDEARGKVRLEAAPIIDEKLSFLREVYRSILANPSGFLEEFGMLDTDSLKDAIGVPKSDMVAAANEDGSVDGLGDIAVPVPGVDPEQLRSGVMDGVTPGVATADQAAAKGEVQGTALNGAQIASIVEICGKVGTGELTKPAALELIQIAFPLLELAKVQRLIAAIEVKSDAATTVTPTITP